MKLRRAMRTYSDSGVARRRVEGRRALCDEACQSGREGGLHIPPLAALGSSGEANPRGRRTCASPETPAAGGRGPSRRGHSQSPPQDEAASRKARRRATPARLRRRPMHTRDGAELPFAQLRRVIRPVELPHSGQGRCCGGERFGPLRGASAARRGGENEMSGSPPRLFTVAILAQVAV